MILWLDASTHVCMSADVYVHVYVYVYVYVKYMYVYIYTGIWLLMNF